MTKVTPADDNNNNNNNAGEGEAVEMVDEPLFDHESGLGGMMGDGVTTVTFYEGDMAAGVAYLRDRLAVVAAANPWIFGCIVKEKHGKRAALRFPKHPPP